jgi:hypothetical protein
MRAALLVLLLAAPQDPDATERLLRVVERRHRETPDPTDARAAAARLGFDRAKIAEFVAGLSWEPYAGILRDAGGTLMCRGGNSIDRALLLQAMLEAGGEKTRLMRADLAEPDGTKLVEAFRKQQRKDRPESDLRPLATELGVDAAALETAVSERRRERAALVDEVVGAAKTEASRLAPLVGALTARSAAAPKEHVWVQVLDKGAWVDVDPSPVKGGREMSPQDIAAQRRSVTLRLILNRKGGPVPLLSVPADLTAVAWKPVDLLIQPAPGQVPHSSKLRALDAKGVVAAFKQVKQYRPCLLLDGKAFGGVPFDLNGQTYTVDAGGRTGPATALSRGLGNAFGGALGGGGEEAPPAPALESVVLEVAVKEPGARERIHRRELVTASKPGARGLPFLRYSFLIDGAPLPAGEFARREVKAIAANAASFHQLNKGQTNVHFNLQVDVSPTLLLFGDLRRRAQLRLGEESLFVQDRVGLAADTSQVFLDEEGGRVLLRQGIDIFDNPGYFDGSAERTMTLGAAETALECLLVERSVPGTARRSAWTLLERGRLQGGKPEVSDRDGRRDVRWSAEAWWSIDPAGGSCVGRVPSGAGQGLIENLIESAGQVCSYADAVGFLSGASGATGRQPAWADTTTKGFGKACSALGGTSVRDELKDQIDEMTKNLWLTAIDSLAGM